MDRQALLLRSVSEQANITQRELSACLHASLGATNQLIKSAAADGLIEARETGGYAVTEAGYAYLKPYRVEAALILAAGFGSRFVPLTYETPKGLLEVFGEPMIERQIKQLHEAGITDITIMVGYLKEKFEYLQDKYGVKLLYNPEYTDKNTLATIWHARGVLSGRNCYILNGDNWMRHNLYHRYEGGAWYGGAHADGPTSEWVLITDKKGRITETYPGGRDCDYMYGPAYFSAEFSAQFLPVLSRYYEMPGTEQYYWEHVLMEMLNGQARRRLVAYFGHFGGEEKLSGIEMHINLQAQNEIYEFENLEELRAFDEKYQDNSGSEAMQLVSRVFSVPESQIRRIRCLKAGMTNHSWLFEIAGKSYICRIPGEGTEKLINRREEKASYDAISGTDLAERVIYFDETSGYKISRFYENSRNADPHSEEDMRACMKRLRELHAAKLQVAHRFDIAGKIAYYEKLCLAETDIKGLSETEALKKAVPFADYLAIREEKELLCAYLAALARPEVLSHMDAVHDNFIFLPDTEKPKLIDWEYAAMNDPLIDISMCAIYAYMDETAAEQLMRDYFDREPTALERNIVYAYMALGGLLWALWGVYKEKLGVMQYTDYTLRMYRYFKQYYKKVDRTLGDRGVQGTDTCYA